MPKTVVHDNESLDDALRRFKRQVSKAGTLAEARKREFYLKPGIKRKLKSEMARRNNKGYQSIEALFSAFFLSFFIYINGDNMLSFTKDYLRVIDFKNIIYMDDKKLNIMFKNYFVKIQGSNLEIKVYGYKEIIVKGIVSNIEITQIF